LIHRLINNADLARAGKYEFDVHFLHGIDGELMTLQPIPDESQFVILEAGDSRAENHAFSVPGGGKKLSPGNYVLQLSVLTWHYANASNIEWREKWRQKGHLWTNSVTSQPMSFTVYKNPVVTGCP
jgi:hypothetical protein